MHGRNAKPSMTMYTENEDQERGKYNRMMTMKCDFLCAFFKGVHDGEGHLICEAFHKPRI